MECIVHYDNQTKYSAVKRLSERNLERIKQAKEKRLKIGGINSHKEQCDQIPVNIDTEIHGVHLEPCYKRFTSILGNKKFQEEEKSTTRQSDRLSSPVSTRPSPAWVYPKECNLCFKYRVQHKSKKFEPYGITTLIAEKTIKTAAETKNKKLYNEIKSLDLIAKEFKVHKHCYQQFTSGFASGSRSLTMNESGPSDSTTQVYDKGEFEVVKEFVENEVIEHGKAVSMETLHELYKLGVGDTRYRSKLKQRLQNHFNETISFLSPSTSNLAEVVVCTACLDGTFTTSTPEDNVKTAANIIQKDILNKFKDLPDMNWPPTSEQLSNPLRKPPESLYTFLKSLLRYDNHHADLSSNLNRLVESFAQDLAFAVTRGKVIQSKHFLLGLGLHNLTGGRKVIDIVHKLGHCISYNATCEIETAQAECALQAINQTNILPWQPASSNDVVLTHFWVDNFDLKVERLGGGGSINTTHLVAFQENLSHHKSNTSIISVPRKKSRKLMYDDVNIPLKPVDVHKEPTKIKGNNVSYLEEVEIQVNWKYFVWVYSRKQNGFNQGIPSFKGWSLQIRSNPRNQISKTVETYLPPITTKVTDFTTIQKYLSYLQGLASRVNMPYVNITLDVGAAINAYKMVWNYPEQYQNVVIHLGCFHFLKENFQVLGSLATGSGFEDVVYQSGLCTSGSLQGVLAGSHYNRAWAVHSIFSEALERMLLTRFLVEKNPTIPDVLTEYCADPNSMSVNEPLLESISVLLHEYEIYRDGVRTGVIGKTAQFWLIYLDLVRKQILAHNAVQTNDLEMLICGWKSFLPMYFAMNKVNYARYGTYYVHVLMNIDDQYPGLKNYMEKGGFSIQGQNHHSIRTATDQRGEQTINKDAKISGGIKAFASNKMNVLKWCLTRPHQAKHFKELKHFSGIDAPTNCYKPLRKMEISRSEQCVQKVIDVLESEYLNPFSVNLDNDKLYNLSSGIPKVDRVEELLQIWQNGKSRAEEFLQQRIMTTEKPFHNPLPRVKIPTFQEVRMTVVKDKRTKVIDANRHIISRLLSLSAKSEKPIDFQKAFKHSLYPVPLSLAYPDGSKRETPKSKLMEVIAPDVPVIGEQEDIIRDQSVFVIDMIAQLRMCLCNVPDTFEELILRFLRSIPKGYRRTDIVADTYRSGSIKSAERQKRGTSSKVLIGSVRSKVPRDVNKFMLNNENKSALISLIFKYVIHERHQILTMLETGMIVLSGDNECHTVTVTSSVETIELKSNQEEADTKVILHTLHVLRNSELSVVLRSPSGDTDIMVLALGIITEHQDRVYFDYGSGKNRKGTWLNAIIMKDCERKALIGFHSFSGNDYISAFFRKGKKCSWKVMTKNDRFLQAFSEFGNTYELDTGVIGTLEEYVCCLYGSKKNSVNVTRFDMFMKKQTQESKAIDLSCIPPCYTSLVLHMHRANYVAAVWKRTENPYLTLPDITEHGWNFDGSIQWIDQPFPENIADLLIDDTGEDEDEDEGGSNESEIDSDSFGSDMESDADDELFD